MLKIGSVTLPTNILLAPLAGISDGPFRMICREHGCRFTSVEMINARAVAHHSKKTKRMLAADPGDRPLGVQILGCELPYVLKGLEVMETFAYDILDFNAACPVRKVCRRGEGTALMKEPEKLKELLGTLVKHSTRPVTIKLRSGWDKETRNAPDIARLAEACGVAAVFIHGRTREQFYKGTVDYGIIAAVKKAVRVPVIGSGDVLSARHAKKMFDETGCDGVLVARGALGHPWIFREIEAYLEDGRLPEPVPLATILETFTRHLELSIAEHTEKRAVKIMRKFVGWYLKGQPNIRVLRQAVSTARTRQELTRALQAHLPAFTPV